MARRVWIAILGFGLLLFVLLDVTVLYEALNSARKVRDFGFFSGLVFVTWQVYLALKRRIDERPDRPLKSGENVSVN